VYVCPQSQPLRPYRRELSAEKVEYRAAPATCNACPVKAQCTPSCHGRIVHRHFAEAYLDRVRGYHQGEPYAKAMRKRKVWVEPLFAEGKQWHGMRRFRLRSLWRVNTEALLLATGQNFKRLLQLRGWGRRPFPSGAAAGAVARLWVLRRVFMAGFGCRAVGHGCALCRCDPRKLPDRACGLAALDCVFQQTRALLGRVGHGSHCSAFPAGYAHVAGAVVRSFFGASYPTPAAARPHPYRAHAVEPPNRDDPLISPWQAPPCCY
jgi:hypothetical protein